MPRSAFGLLTIACLLAGWASLTAGVAALAGHARGVVLVSAGLFVLVALNGIRPTARVFLVGLLALLQPPAPPPDAK